MCSKSESGCGLIGSTRYCSPKSGINTSVALAAFLQWDAYNQWSNTLEKGRINAPGGII